MQDYGQNIHDVEIPYPGFMPKNIHRQIPARGAAQKGHEQEGFSAYAVAALQ